MMRIAHLLGPNGQVASLVAGITGLASDAATVRDELVRLKPKRVLLGVPFEDLDSIRATSGKEHEAEFESADLDDVYMQRLKEYGAAQAPPPDLYEAFRAAQAQGADVLAIDLSDEAHTESYARNVGFFEVMRSNRNQRRVASADFVARTAEEFVQLWDERLHGTKGLRKVQQEREEAMAKAIQAQVDGPLLALLPLARAAGVQRRLAAAGWRAA